MKNKIFCFLTALLLAVSMVDFPVYATQPTASPAVREEFYQQLADLVSKDDYSKFFGEMKLRIGSNILIVDGEKQIMDVAPEVVNNRTMLPIRAVAETAGAEVNWVQDTSTVLIESVGGDTIQCAIGSPTIMVNSQASQMDVTPYVKQNRTYLPVRAVAEALELEVEWDASTQTVRLTAPYQSGRLIVLADQLDTRGLDAETVISDGAGMWVLQFATPTQARTAVEILETRGIEVEPDIYIPPIEDNSDYEMASAGTHYSWGVEDCGFDSFVNKYASSFSGTGVVAVVDTGVDSTHPFLKGRVLSNGYDFIDGDSTPNDGHSHGTHVAGTIIDCVGSAPVSILPVRVLNNQGSGTSSIVASGIKYAADHGADVINLSLGGGCSIAKDSAVSYAIGKGCLVVSAAGNDNINTANTCPAHITEGGSVVVSAGNSSHQKAGFSNYGASVDLMAPGVSIKATVPGGSFETWSGTSMAAPHASAAAILLDLAWGKTLTPAALETKLYTATTYGKWTNSTVGAGFLDLSKASVPSTGITPGISLNYSSLSLKAGESQVLTASVTPSGTAVSWSSSNTSVATVSNGKVTAVGQGTATVTAQIVYSGTACQAKCTVTVTSAVTPGISLDRSSLSLKVGESQTLTASATPSGTAVSWNSSDTKVAAVSSGKVTAASPGSTSITAKISYGGKIYTASCTVTVTGETSEWTTTKLPAKDGYTVQTKTQYRSKNKELYQSSLKGISGWTLYDTKTETTYGAWSEWKNGSIFNYDANKTQVETRQTAGTSTTYYNLYYYKYWNSSAGAYYYTYSSNMGGTKYTVTAKASDCIPYQSYDGHQAYTYNGFNLWWVESTTFRQTNSGQQYRTRTKTETTTYYYYRWTDWSAWQDSPVTAGDSVRVETRILYRYVPVN